jgi:L-alanine-DL-glutamate epimerase-like enolase superfamily enzyme
MTSPQRLKLDARLDVAVLREPFHISGRVFQDVPVLFANLTEGGLTGRGEASGVYYNNDDPPQMLQTLEALRGEIEAGLDRAELRALLPSGGARNALDAALWELEALRAGKAVWQLAGVSKPRPLLTTMTCGAASPEKMAADAVGFSIAKAIKLKLTGETDLDIERVKAVRKARPDVWLGVDANQGFTPKTIAPLFTTLVDCDVRLLEQPFARGAEEQMKAIDFPIPTAADESCLNLAELEQVHPLFDVINIKLDKCGGLTEGLMMARRAKALGKKVMVGCMIGSSLSTAVGFVLGQLCDIVDLDSPISLLNDHQPSVRYDNGEVFSPPEVWGGFASADAHVA